jgi:hypothetical protein
VKYQLVVVAKIADLVSEDFGLSNLVDFWAFHLVSQVDVGRHYSGEITTVFLNFFICFSFSDFVGQKNIDQDYWLLDRGNLLCGFRQAHSYQIKSRDILYDASA